MSDLSNPHLNRAHAILSLPALALILGTVSACNDGQSGGERESDPTTQGNLAESSGGSESGSDETSSDSTADPTNDHRGTPDDMPDTRAGEDGAGNPEDDGEGSGESDTSGANDDGVGDTETGEDDGSGEEPGGESGTGTSEEGGDDGPSESGLVFMIVEPYDQVVEVDLNTPTSFPYTVVGYFNDGTSSDLTDKVEWATSDAAYGTMAGPSLDIPGIDTAGVGTNNITASHDGKDADARITVAAYDHANDFFFLLPHDDPSGNQEKPLNFSTDVQAMDVFFNMDTTGSMGDEIVNLRNSLNQIITNIKAEVEDTQFGVGRFDDFPLSPYGAGADQPFFLHQEITGDIDAVTAAVAALDLHNGNDGPESHLESLYQIATGEGLNNPAPTSVAANNSGVGGVGFREGTIPVTVSITDAITHTVAPDACGNAYGGDVSPFAHSRDQTKAALNEICARTITVATGSFNEGGCGAVGDGIDLANGTGTRIHPDAWNAGGRPAACAAGKCCLGANGASIDPDADGLCPLVYRAGGNGTGVGDSVKQGIQMVAQYTPFTVTVEVIGKGESEDGTPLPGGKTTADFIKNVTPNKAGAPPLAGLPDPVIKGNTFENVTPGTEVFFDVEAFNDFVPSATKPQLFLAQIRVLAGDCAVNLDTRDVWILVPPKSQ